MSAETYLQPSKHPKVTCFQVVDTDGVLAKADELEMLKIQMAEMQKTINRMNDSFTYAVKMGAGSASSAEERKQMAEALAKEFPDEVLKQASMKVQTSVANYTINNYGLIVQQQVLSQIKQKHIEEIKGMIRDKIINQAAQEIQSEGVLKEACARAVDDACEDAKRRVESMLDLPKDVDEKFEEYDDAVTRVVEAIADIQARVGDLESRVATLSLTNCTKTGDPETPHEFAQPQKNCALAVPVCGTRPLGLAVDDCIPCALNCAAHPGEHDHNR